MPVLFENCICRPVRQMVQSPMQSLRSRLQNSAALLSQSIDAQELEAIRTPADTEQDIYRGNLAKLRRLRRANPDIAFL